MNNSIEVNNLDVKLINYRYIRIPDRIINNIYRFNDYDIITYNNVKRRIGLVALYKYNNRIYGSWSIVNPSDTFDRSTAIELSMDRVIKLISENQSREYHDCGWDKFPTLDYETVSHSDLLKLFRSQLFDLAKYYYLNK